MLCYWPLEKAYVTSHFRTKERPDHDGTDYRAPEGTPVYALRAGIVVLSLVDEVAGQFLRIRHEDGSDSNYHHLSARLVEAGQAVEAGQEIALSGNSGRSTGPHLHLGIRDGAGRYVNPHRFLVDNRAATPGEEGEGMYEASDRKRDEVQTGIQRRTETAAKAAEDISRRAREDAARFRANEERPFMFRIEVLLVALCENAGLDPNEVLADAVAVMNDRPEQ